MELKSRLFTRKNIHIFIALATLLVIHYRMKVKRNEISTKPLKEFVEYYKDLHSNILCYKSDENDDLYSADYTNFPESNKLIFFHETSCKGGLDSRQACSIESAARSNPDWKIYVLFAGPVGSFALNGATFKTLLLFDNIQVKRIHPVQYSKGTPLEKMFAYDFLARSFYPVHHGSDAIRFLTLYKHGGVHLDLDMIVTKSFNYFSNNFFARQQEGDEEGGSPIGTAVIRLSKDKVGKLFSRNILDEIVNNFHPYEWDDNGPGLLRRVLRNMCSTDNLTQMAPETCRGLDLYPPELLFPYSYNKAYIISEEGALAKMNEIIEGAFAIHIWNKITQDSDIKNTVYARLAENYCPSIFKLYGRNLGW